MVDDENKIQRFKGGRNDDYNLWRIRAVAALKWKWYYSCLQAAGCPDTTKEKAAAILICALGDTPLRVCGEYTSDPIKILELLDACYASSRATTRILVMTSLYSKRFTNNYDMDRYIDELESLFAQLLRIGKAFAVPESHKVGILLASMGTHSKLENSCAALRMKDIDDLKWESVTADLIQE